MKNTVTVIIGGIAVVALILGGLALAKPGVQGPPGRDGVGALPGNELNSDTWKVNGLGHYYKRVALRTATTTPCAIQSPSATSTLLHGGLRLSKGTTTDATLWTVAKAANGFATTTAFDQFSVTAPAVGTMFVGAASSTAPDELAVFAPNQWLVWGVAGTVPGDSTNLTGVCQAEFIII